MAKRKAKKAAPRRRAATRKTARRGRSRGRVSQMSMGGALEEIAKGVLGAVLATKVAPMIPIADTRIRNGAVAIAGGMLAMKSREFRAIGLGMGIASGTLLLNDFFPNLLGPAGAVAGVGRLTPGTQRRMQAAAERIRAGIAGPRGRTIMGNGSGGDFPVPVNGMRGKTIMGSGGGSFSY